MEYKNYYLIEYGKQDFLVLAKNGHEAVTLWIESNDNRYKEEHSKFSSFRPENFTVKRIVREDELIKASE